MTTYGAQPPPRVLPNVNAKNPPSLSTNTFLKEFATWRANFEDYATITESSALPLQQQLAILRSYLDDELLAVLDHTIGVPRDSSLPVTNVLDKLHGYFKEQGNESVRRLAFTNCKQGHLESFESYCAGV